MFLPSNEIHTEEMQTQSIRTKATNCMAHNKLGHSFDASMFCYASLNISTSHFTSTFTVTSQLMHYVNYLLTYFNSSFYY